jgi:hypothetical protein
MERGKLAPEFSEKLKPEKLFQMELLSLNLYSLFPITFLSLNLIRIWGVGLADEPS